MIAAQSFLGLLEVAMLVEHHGQYDPRWNCDGIPGVAVLADARQNAFGDNIG